MLEYWIFSAHIQAFIIIAQAGLDLSMSQKRTYSLGWKSFFHQCCH